MWFSAIVPIPHSLNKRTKIVTTHYYKKKRFWAFSIFRDRNRVRLCTGTFINPGLTEPVLCLPSLIKTLGRTRRPHPGRRRRIRLLLATAAATCSSLNLATTHAGTPRRPQAPLASRSCPPTYEPPAVAWSSARVYASAPRRPPTSRPRPRLLVMPAWIP